MSERQIRSLGIEREGQASIISYNEGDPAHGHVRLETLYTGFSAGTELTFMKHTNPYFHSRWDGDRGVFVPGEPSLHFPVPFLGYMEVARVVDSRDPAFHRGQILATTFGHKTGHTADPSRDVLIPMPDDLDPVLGVFVAQMGPIAANGILHADAEHFGTQVTRLGQSLTDKPVLVIGAGAVGLMTALFARQAGASEVLVADPSPWRRERLEAMGFLAMHEDDAWHYARTHWHSGGERGADFVFQTRAHSGSLHSALRALRPQGTVIDLAFYQGGADDLRLGEEFHHNGLAIRCAQINRVPRGLGHLWDRRRLGAETVSMLRKEQPTVLREVITHIVRFDDGPAFLGELVQRRPEFMQIVFQVAE
ncbi:zinc-dependent alcohol dehydrogenase [Devosia rhizoryzae]|uniref:zinc-dependent alcohol dehydrogenase n=1 Tax=Devosia rhizoryzae TaxID=2774137 RepID=UPI002D80EA85|nr:zinc-binding alcohol dehydrogenase [Devosia rhizoryzae]